MHLYVLGGAVIAGSVTSMVALIRRSRFMPLVTIVTGAVGTVFFALLPFPALPGMIGSLSTIPLGVGWFLLRRRVRKQLVLSDSTNLRRPEEYLSDSGHWRFRAS